MKILYFNSIDNNSYMSKWQYYHFIDELTHHNIQVTTVAEHLIQSPECANDNCLKLLDEVQYDLFMTVCGNSLYSSTLEKITKKGVPRLLINFDNLLNPYEQISQTQYYDLVMLLNVDNNPVYNKYKCPCIFTPYAANPFFLKDLRSNHVNKPCFVGTPYGTRCRSINTLLHAGINVDLFANESSIREQKTIAAGLSLSDKIKSVNIMMKSLSGRKVLVGALMSRFSKYEVLDADNNHLTIKPAIDLDRMNEVYSNYALSLSMPEARNTGYLKNPVDVVRLRNFEIPMCAGLQITRFCKELSEYYEEDKEILFYRSNDELIDKIKYYTNPLHQKEVDNIKTNARKRSEAEHTWFNRFKVAFDKLGLKYE